VGWSESLRLELLRTGIDVSAVLLPSVATPMFDHARMKLGYAPQPIPPTYDTDIAARAVVRCALRPTPRAVPVFLQGRLILWLQRWASFVGDFVLSRWGQELQMRNRRVDPTHGNLFAPVPEGVGPYGSVPPTAPWKRWGAGAMVLLLAASVLGGLGFSAARAARALRSA
jgi:hypothetical protein